MAKKLLVIIVGIIFAGAGIYMTVTGVSIIRKARASVDWPAVAGRITGSEVKVHRSETGTGRKRRTRTSYKPAVMFAYKVEGVPYSSDKVIFGSDSYDSRYKAEKVVNKYPAGTDVTVYYDPESPDYAVLEPGMKSSSYAMLIMGIVFLGTGVITSFIGLIRRFP